jgi:hypothetical protein
MSSDGDAASGAANTAGQDLYQAGNDQHFHDERSYDLRGAGNLDNDISGTAETVVQAAHIHGDVIINTTTQAALNQAGVVRAWGNVPTRNLSFTGRAEQLTAIRRALTAEDGPAIQALHGMGGVGKTQLAIEYAHRHAVDYNITWWVDSDNPALLAQQFADLATKLGYALAPGTLPEAIRSAVHCELHARDRWLLIFDNAEAPDVIGPWLPSGQGHVLITSRTDDWDELASQVPIDVLPRIEAVQFLQSRVSTLRDADADMLSEALGDLPLALAQGAAYIAKTRMTAATYIALLHEQAADLLSEGRVSSYARPHTADRTLTAVVTLAHDRLQQTDPDAATLAMICAYLAPEPIPVDWLVAAAKVFPGSLPTRLASLLQRNRLLATLTDTALARLDADGLIIHRLTQAILRASAPDSDAASACAEHVATAARPGDKELPENWPAWARLLPHILALSPDISTDPNLRDMAYDATWYLIRSGHPAGAHNLAAALHRAWRDRLGPDHPQTLRSTYVLASCLYELGQYQAARELDEDTLRRRQQTLGPDHPDTLWSANNLANDLRELGERQAARQLNQDTLRRRQQTFGPDHPDTLWSAGDLAIDLRALGEYQAARDLDTDTLQRRQQTVGPDHPDTLWSAHSLAIDLRALGEYQAARDLDTDTLARRRRWLGPGHPDTQESERGLAEDVRLLGEQGR